MVESEYGMGCKLAGLYIQQWWGECQDFEWGVNLAKFHKEQTEARWNELFCDDPDYLPLGQTAIEKVVEVFEGKRPVKTKHPTDDPLTGELTITAFQHAHSSFRISTTDAIRESSTSTPEHVLLAFEVQFQNEEFLRGFSDTLVSRFKMLEVSVN